jgi:hypothetical protein
MSGRYGLPPSIRDSVHHELDRLGEGPGGADLADLASGWAEAVGDTIARNAWPARRRRDGTVLVHTSSSAWAQELTHLEEQVRAKLGQAAPRLRFVVGPLPEAGRESVPDERRSLHRPTEREDAQAAEMTREVSVEAVREAIRKACALSLAAQRTERTDRSI